MRNAIKRIDVEKLNTETVLRPEYTLLVLERMVNRGDSLNLVGEKGTGKSRLIKDIRRFNLEGVKIICLDVKSYQRNFTGLLKEFATQLDFSGTVPDNLGQLFAGIERQPGRFLILLDNYDALLANTNLDVGFTEPFFSDLNALKNKDNVSLLCTTCIAHYTLPVYINGNTLTSPLTLDINTLPPLAVREIKNEIHRRVDEYNSLEIRTHPEEKDSIIAYIHDFKYPYPRLKWFCSKLDGQNEEERMQSFKKKIKKWNKTFDQNAGSGLEKNLSKMSSKVEELTIASKANKIKIPIISDIRKLIEKWTGKLH